MMLERERAAQTAYMARMGKRVGGEAGAAIGMGETRRQYVTAQDQLKTAQAQRDTAKIAAESPFKVQQEKTRGDIYVADQGTRRAEIEQSGMTDRQAAELKLKREQYTAPGLYRNQFGTFSIGADPVYAPTEIAGGRGYMGPKGDITAFPVPDPVAPPEPIRVGGSLVDPVTGNEVYREPTEMEEFDQFARDRFKSSSSFPADATNEEIEAAYQEWFKKEYPPKKR